MLGIVTRPAARRKSEWSRVVTNRGNAWGAKGPYGCPVEFSEGGDLLVGANPNITERTHVELPLAFEANDRGLPEAVFKLRKRLYIKARQEPRFRFYTLYDRMLRPGVLAVAWDQVVANDGAPGVDGVRVEDNESAPGGVERFVEELRDDLKHKRYRPQAVRLKLIPKANGGQRLLGIPTVRDRVVQTAAKLVLEPIFKVTSTRSLIIS